MSVEKFPSMSEESAHEEANMLRAKARISPESGKVEGVDMRRDHEPTAKDYEDALAEVERLRRLAEEDPDALKVWGKMNTNIVRLLTLPGLGVRYLMRISHALIGPEPGGPKERWKRNAEFTEPMAEFDGIERELRMLRDKAEKFEAKEAQSKGKRAAA